MSPELRIASHMFQKMFHFDFQLLCSPQPFRFIHVLYTLRSTCLGKDMESQIPAAGVFKRIRGPALEKAGVVKRPVISRKPEKVPQLALANKLLSCWSSGSLSATATQEIANLAMQDGASHQEIYKLGKAGDWGRCPSGHHD